MATNNGRTLTMAMLAMLMICTLIGCNGCLSTHGAGGKLNAEPAVTTTAPENAAPLADPTESIVTTDSFTDDAYWDRIHEKQGINNPNGAAPQLVHAEFEASGDGIISVRGGVVTDPADIPPLPDVRALRDQLRTKEAAPAPVTCVAVYSSDTGWEFPEEACDCSVLPPAGGHDGEQFECTPLP